MTKTIVLALALQAGISAFDSAAADPYRWCAQYGGWDGPTNCYFMTLGQCQAAISGVGGYCRPNAFYTGPDDPPARRKRHR